MEWIDWLIALFGDAQLWLFEALVQPLVFHLGLGNLVEDAFRGTGWLLVGLLQIGVMLTAIRALERWRPVEAVRDRAAVRVDMLYTLLHRLGLVRLAFFFLLEPLVLALGTELRMAGVPTWQLDQAWPGVTDIALVSFLLYLLLLDCVDWLIHRGQHRFHRWWALHAVHHSQRQMTMWSDNRNHLLDDALRDLILAGVALGVGMAPGQFVAVVAFTQLLESLSHANTRLSFGPVLGRLLVSPAYHRAHHAIGFGHESHGPQTLGGCNFAVLFPLWDILAGTARFHAPPAPTGIRDQLPDEGGRDYGSSFWAQQWLGLKRLLS